MAGTPQVSKAALLEPGPTRNRMQRTRRRQQSRAPPHTLACAPTLNGRQVAGGSPAARRACDTRRPSVAARVLMTRRSCAAPHTAQPAEGGSGGTLISSRLLHRCSSTYVTCAGAGLGSRARAAHPAAMRERIAPLRRRLPGLRADPSVPNLASLVARISSGRAACGAHHARHAVRGPKVGAAGCASKAPAARLPLSAHPHTGTGVRGAQRPRARGTYQMHCSVMTCCMARTLHASGRRASTFNASTTMSPPTIALVVAIAWMMFPAMPCARAAPPVTPGTPLAWLTRRAWHAARPVTPDAPLAWLARRARPHHIAA